MSERSERKRLNRAEQRENERQFNQLLFAVERKFPGESRFDTALRYIQEAERNATNTGTKVAG